MESKNCVYIATSLDGYIAEISGSIEFLESIHIPENTQMGYDPFMERIDALVMGRKTFEKVLSFGIEWPYDKMVYVWSNSLDILPQIIEKKATIISGSIQNILNIIHNNGHLRLYIDGGKTIQSFLKADLIDEMIITVFPILLGNGIPLFGETNTHLEFELIESKIFVGQLVQNHYLRKKNGSSN